MLTRSVPLISQRLQLVKSASVVRNYHEKVLDHYEKPRNVGSLDKNDSSVGTGIVGAPACGDVMKLQIKVYFSSIIII
jgi:NifU-like protein involved in Fe-S cluster formation